MRNSEIAYAHLSTKELRLSRLFLWSLKQKPSLILGKHLLQEKFIKNQMIKSLIRNTFFKQFCGGEDRDSCKEVQKKLEKRNINIILDYAVEACQSSQDVVQTLTEIQTILTKNQHAAVLKPSSLINTNILQKVSAYTALTQTEQKEWLEFQSRLQDLGTQALNTNCPLFIDAEESWYQNAVDNLVENLMQTINTDQPIIYHTVQMYRHDRLQYLKNLLKSADDYYLGIKLVRGAYLEQEKSRAQTLGYKSPIHASKAATDQDYDAAVEIIMKHPKVALVIASHNENSINLALQQQELNQSLSFAQLYGMGDHLSFNLAAAAKQVYKYLPYGPIEKTVPYLIRRAEENSSLKGQASQDLELISQELKRRRGHGKT